MSRVAPEHKQVWTPNTPLPRFSDLRERHRVDERMDDPNIDPHEQIQALSGLRRINAVSATAASFWPVLHKHAKRKPIRVLDLACGGGDVTIALARKAQRSNLDIAFEGCDISPTATRFAQDTAAHKGVDVAFFEHDAIQHDFPHDYDVIYSSLFFHHLATPQVKPLLAKMAAAAPTVMINDLIRSRAGLLLAYGACHALTRSPVVHFDGPSSVAAAFTIAEFRAIVNEAGLNDYTISWTWPFRFLFTCERSAAT